MKAMKTYAIGYNKEMKRKEAWDRLAETMDSMSRQAIKNGLTETGLKEILKDIM